MKTFVILAVVAAAVAFAPACEAASKSRKKGVKRAPVTTGEAARSRHDVYVGGELVGSDPDPFIRMMIRRDPKPGNGEF